MARKFQLGLMLFSGLSIVVIFNEFLIYHVALWSCSFPNIVDPSEKDIVRALILADPHLLGEKRGAWIDRLRREWQMERTFQTAVNMLEPDVVFIVGDVMDEGFEASEEDFKFAFERYQRIFRRPENIPMLLVAGNHDIGFHYAVKESNVDRFEKTFDVPSVQVVQIRNIPFVLLNSVGLTADGCWLCSAVQAKIKSSAKALRKCAPDVEEESCLQQPIVGTHPILLQHYPLYRSSDLLCHGDDLAPDIANQPEFRESWEVVSKEATETVLSHFQPRLVFSGHTHHGCNIMHHLGTPFPTEEQTIASFSWRNKNQPNFVLLTASSTDYSFDKCYPPSESFVVVCYVLALLVAVAVVVGSYCSQRRYVKRVGDTWSQSSWSNYDWRLKSRKGT